MRDMPSRQQINPEALIRAREKAGDGSKSAAAAAAGLTWQGYEKWEKGLTTDRFDWNAFMSLCDYLGVSPADITVPVPIAEDVLRLLEHLNEPITLRRLVSRLKKAGQDIAPAELRGMLRQLIGSGYARSEAHGHGRAVTYLRVETTSVSA